MSPFTLKFTAAAALVLLGAAGGRYQAGRLAARERMIGELIDGIHLFRNEIYYTHDRLERISERLVSSCRGCSSDLFLCFYRELEERAAGDTAELWNDAVLRAFGRRSPLRDCDLDTLRSAGVRLGRDDIEGQCAYLEKTAGELEVRLREARSDRLARSSLCKTLGVAAGCGAAILVF